MEPDGPPPKKYAMKPREFARLDSRGPAGQGAGHDVYAILRQNRAAEQRHGLGKVEIKRIRSRRKRDYWLLLLTANPLFTLVAWLGRANAAVLVSAVAGIILFSVGLSWIMWFVMDDY